jgi:hypothetical protein
MDAGDVVAVLEGVGRRHHERGEGEDEGKGEQSLHTRQRAPSAIAALSGITLTGP